MTFPTPGPYVLTDGRGLPNVTVAFPGEHFSQCKASGIINPGDVVVPFASATPTGTQRYVRRATGSDNINQCAIALQPVSPPDVNIGSLYNPVLGPNEIVNRPLTQDSYVHEYYSGYFHLTVATPDTTYGPGDLVGWDPAAALPSGKPWGVPVQAAPGSPFPASSTPLAGQPTAGAWRKGAPVGPLAEVIEFRPYGGAAVAGEGILTVRLLRANP